MDVVDLETLPRVYTTYNMAGELEQVCAHATPHK